MHRTTAAKLGLKFYKADRNCRRGHNSKRYTSSGNCVECHQILHSGVPKIEIRGHPHKLKVLQALSDALGYCELPLDELAKARFVALIWDALGTASPPVAPPVPLPDPVKRSGGDPSGGQLNDAWRR